MVCIESPYKPFSKVVGPQVGKGILCGNEYKMSVFITERMIKKE